MRIVSNSVMYEGIARSTVINEESHQILQQAAVSRRGASLNVSRPVVSQLFGAVVPTILWTLGAPRIYLYIRNISPPGNFCKDAVCCIVGNFSCLKDREDTMCMLFIERN